MRRIAIVAAWGLAGLVVALGLTVGAFAVAGQDIGEPATPPGLSLGSPAPEATDSPSSGPSPSNDPSEDGPSSDPTGSDDDNSGPGSGDDDGGSDDNSGPGSGDDDGGSDDDNSGPGSGDDGGGSDDDNSGPGSSNSGSGSDSRRRLIHPYPGLGPDLAGRLRPPPYGWSNRTKEEAT